MKSYFRNLVILIIVQTSLNGSTQPFDPFKQVPLPNVALGKLEHIASSLICGVASTLFQACSFALLKKIGFVKKKRSVDWDALIADKTAHYCYNFYANFIAEQEQVSLLRKRWLVWAYGAPPPSKNLEYTVRGITFAWFMIRSLLELYFYTRKHPRCFQFNRPLETIDYAKTDLLFHQGLRPIPTILHEVAHFVVAWIIDPALQPKIVALDKTKPSKNPQRRSHFMAISSAGGLIGGLVSVIGIISASVFGKTIFKKPQFIKNEHDESQYAFHALAKRTIIEFLSTCIKHFDNLLCPLGPWEASQENFLFTGDGGTIYLMLKITPSPLWGF